METLRGNARELLEEWAKEAGEELGLPEPQMRRYKVVLDQAVETVEAEDYDHSVEAASYVFSAAGRKVYEVARHWVTSIRDLGPVGKEEG